MWWQCFFIGNADDFNPKGTHGGEEDKDPLDEIIK
jgi:hypothetical protein